jgi:hypothetical protein
VLDDLWEHVAAGRTPSASILKQRLEECDRATPSEEWEPWSEQTGLAENAAAAVYYCVRSFLSDDPQEVIWAARQNIEALDLFLRRRVNINPNDPAYEAFLAGQPLMRAEVERQARDLSQLVADEIDVTLLQGRARIEALIVFG